MDDLRQAAIDTALKAINDIQSKDPLRDEYIVSEMEEKLYTECKVNLYSETKLRFVLDKCIEDEELIEKILKALDEVSERWIPVTERLPEAYGRYLVTLEDEDYRSVMPLYYGRTNRKDVFYDSDSEYGDVYYDDVIAWMPLPSPYKDGDIE